MEVDAGLFLCKLKAYICSGESSSIGLIHFMVYQTRHISGLATLLLIIAVVITIVCDFGFISIIRSSGIMTVGLLLLPFIVLVYLAKYFQQRIEVETTGSDRIVVRYLHKPFCDNVANQDILISDIKSYTLSGGSRGKYFTLHLADSSEFTCTVSTFGSTKGFDDITAAIILLIQNNTASVSNNI
jgi:hypothetical protein